MFETVLICNKISAFSFVLYFCRAPSFSAIFFRSILLPSSFIFLLTIFRFFNDLEFFLQNILNLVLKKIEMCISLGLSDLQHLPFSKHVMLVKNCFSGNGTLLKPYISNLELNGNKVSTLIFYLKCKQVKMKKVWLNDSSFNLPPAQRLFIILNYNWDHRTLLDGGKSCWLI